MQPLRFRQIHLDFHTSEKIPGIGANFSKAQFQEMLKRGARQFGDALRQMSSRFELSRYQNRFAPSGFGFRAVAAPDRGVPRDRREVSDLYFGGFGRIRGLQAARMDRGFARGRAIESAGGQLEQMAFDTPYLSYLVEQIEEVVDNYDAGGRNFSGYYQSQRQLFAAGTVGDDWP